MLVRIMMADRQKRRKRKKKKNKKNLYAKCAMAGISNKWNENMCKESDEARVEWNIQRKR